MNRRLWISALLTLVAIAAFIQLAFFRTNAGLPFNITSHGVSTYREFTRFAAGSQRRTSDVGLQSTRM